MALLSTDRGMRWRPDYGFKCKSSIKNQYAYILTDKGEFL